MPNLQRNNPLYAKWDSFEEFFGQVNIAGFVRYGRFFTTAGSSALGFPTTLISNLTPGQSFIRSINEATLPLENSVQFLWRCALAQFLCISDKSLEWNFYFSMDGTNYDIIDGPIIIPANTLFARTYRTFGTYERFSIKNIDTSNTTFIRIMSAHTPIGLTPGVGVI